MASRRSSAGARRGLFWASALLVALAACGPKSVAEAEAKKNVPWLAKQGTADAVAALGRLADTRPDALAALEARGNDQQVYFAAWTATERGAEWGPPLLKAALTDPPRADLAVSALPRGDARLVTFLPELEAAVQRLSPSARAGTMAAVIASVGPAARLTVERRLADPTTRGAMCDGLRTEAATADAKSALLAVSPALRDHASCVAAVVQMAKVHDNVLSWLATSGEAGLVSATTNGDLVCARVAILFQEALEKRTRETLGALAVPLAAAMKRCPRLMDEVTSDALERVPTSRACVLSAIDPYSAGLAEMPKTCAALRGGFLRAESPLHREKAEDALARGCRHAR